MTDVAGGGTWPAGGLPRPAGGQVRRPFPEEVWGDTPAGFTDKPARPRRAIHTARVLGTQALYTGYTHRSQLTQDAGRRTCVCPQLTHLPVPVACSGLTPYLDNTKKWLLTDSPGQSAPSDKGTYLCLLLAIAPLVIRPNVAVARRSRR